MPWNTPVTPVPGTVITTAWAQGTVIANLTHLRLLTGNADPPATGYVVRSTATTGTEWYNLDAALAAKMSIAPISQTTIAGGTNPGFYYSVPGPSDSPLGSGVGFWNFITTKYSDSSMWQLAGSVGGSASVADLYYRLVTGGTPSAWAKIWHSANDGAGSGLDADLFDGQDSSFYATAAALAAGKVPSGLIAAVQTAAAIPSGWVRFAGADGRVLVGAGTTFGQTFTQDEWVGSSWAHQHGVGTLTTEAASGGGAVQSGGASSADVNDHTHAISGSAADATWIPPGYVVVWVIKS